MAKIDTKRLSRFPPTFLVCWNKTDDNDFLSGHSGTLSKDHLRVENCSKIPIVVHFSLEKLHFYTALFSNIQLWPLVIAVSPYNDFYWKCISKVKLYCKIDWNRKECSVPSEYKYIIFDKYLLNIYITKRKHVKKLNCLR